MSDTLVLYVTDAQKEWLDKQSNRSGVVRSLVRLDRDAVQRGVGDDLEIQDRPCPPNRINFYLGEQVKAWIRARSAALGVSQRAYVQELIDIAMEEFTNA